MDRAARKAGGAFIDIVGPFGLVVGNPALHEKASSRALVQNSSHRTTLAVSDLPKLRNVNKAATAVVEYKVHCPNDLLAAASYLW
jgi:hypothetical protein